MAYCKALLLHDHTLRRFLFALLCVLLLAEAALAGAWTQPRGKGIVISTTARKVAPAGELFSGHSDRETNTLRFFAEYGVTDDITAGLTGSIETVSQNLDMTVRLGGHVRYRVWQGEAGVASIQLGGSYPFAENLAGTAVVNDNAEADIRADVLYGHGWQTYLGNSYLSASAGYRWRGGDIADEVRFDLSTGLRPTNRFLGMLNVGFAAPLGGNGDKSLTVSPSIAYIDFPWLGPNDKKPDNLRPPLTYQLHVSYDVMQPEDGLEVGFSIWNRF